MPVGPRGQIRPESTMSAVIMECKIATGEIEEQYMDEEYRQTHRSRSLALKVESRDEDKY